MYSGESTAQLRLVQLRRPTCALSATERAVASTMRPMRLFVYCMYSCCHCGTLWGCHYKLNASRHLQYAVQHERYLSYVRKNRSQLLQQFKQRKCASHSPWRMGIDPLLVHSEHRRHAPNPRINGFSPLDRPWIRIYVVIDSIRTKPEQREKGQIANRCKSSC